MLRFFTLALFAFPLCLSAQSYLNSSSQWRFQGGSAGFDGTGYIYDHRFYFDGDTSIAGKTYFKLYFDRQDTIYNWTTGTLIGYDTTLHHYYGALREESKRFYMTYFYSTQEELIQDFDLQIGDTLSWDICYYPVVVTAVDTVFLGPTPLRRYFLNGFDHVFVLEGACGTSGFKINCPGAIGIEYNLDPVCYSRDGYTVSLRAGSSECSLGASATHHSLPRTLPLSPNPTTGLVRLGLPALSADIRVFDVSGKEVMRKNLQNENLILDLSALPDGIYVVAARHAGATWLGKVVLLK